MSESRQFIYDQLTQGATGIELPGPDEASGQPTGEPSDGEYVTQEEYDSWLSELPATTRDQIEADPEFAQSMWDSTHPDTEGDEEAISDEGEVDEEGQPLQFVDATTVDPRTAALYARAWAGEAARGVPNAMAYASFWDQQAGQRARIEAVRAGELHSSELNETDMAQLLREHFADKVGRARAARGERP